MPISVFIIALTSLLIASLNANTIYISGDYTTTLNLAAGEYKDFEFSTSEPRITGHLQITSYGSQSNAWLDIYFGNRCEKLTWRPRREDNCWRERNNAQLYFDSQPAIFFSVRANLNAAYNVEVKFIPVTTLISGQNFQYSHFPGWERKFQYRVGNDVPCILTFTLQNLDDPFTEFTADIEYNTFRAELEGLENLPTCQDYRKKIYQCFIADPGKIYITVKPSGKAGRIQILAEQASIDPLSPTTNNLTVHVYSGLSKFFRILTEDVGLLRVKANPQEGNTMAHVKISTLNANQCTRTSTVFPRDNLYCWENYAHQNDEGFFAINMGERTNWIFSLIALTSGTHIISSQFFRLEILPKDTQYYKIITMNPKEKQYAYFRVDLIKSDVPGTLNLTAVPKSANGKVSIYYDSTKCRAAWSYFPMKDYYCQTASNVALEGATRSLVRNIYQEDIAFFVVEAGVEGDYAIHFSYKKN